MLYRIHRMKAVARESFRWSAHTAGTAVLKAKDYETAGDIEATSHYAAWKILADGNSPLQPGDVLETINEPGLSPELRIAKYIGFEPAEWFVPVPKQDTAESQGESISQEFSSSL